MRDTRSPTLTRAAEDKENFAINRDAALRAFGAVTTRRGLGPGLGLQIEKGREKRGGRRSVGGAGEADEEENDTPATKRRKGASTLLSLPPSAPFVSRTGTGPPCWGGSADSACANDSAGAQNVSLEDLYQKLDELASHVKTRCITKDDLKHLATKEDLKTLATKVEALEDTVKDRNKKVESLEKTVKDVKQKVEALEKTVKDVNRKVEGLENAVKDMNKKVGALEETVKGLGVKVDEALKKDGTLDKAFARVQTDLTDLKQAIIDLQTVVQVLPGLQRSLADIENYVKTRRAVSFVRMCFQTVLTVLHLRTSRILDRRRLELFRRSTRRRRVTCIPFYLVVAFFVLHCIS